MAERTGISWCDSTFSLWMEGTRLITSDDNWKKPLKWNKASACNCFAKQEYREEHLLGCPQRTRPRVFCASLSDIFEDWKGEIFNSDGDVLYDDRADGASSRYSDKDGHRLYSTMNDVRARLFKLIDATPHLDWLLLTKRPENIRKMWLIHPSGRRDNVWLGTSVENQEYAEKRIPELLKCRDLSPVLFLSCEPMLGPVELSQMSMIDFVISGGDSGLSARPSHPDWFRSLRDQCKEANVPFHFSQFGEWAPIENHHVMVEKSKGGNYGTTPSGEKIFADDKRPLHIWPLLEVDNDDSFSAIRVGVKAAGRLLDGVLHDAFPEARS